MMTIVVDASMALAWLFERQKADEIECADRALQTLVDADASVPSLWHTEIANALLVGERRKVVTESQVFEYLAKLSALPIATDSETPLSRRDVVMALAREHKLTAYDATYLDLALRTNAVLATFDIQLADAMRRAGGIVFG
jgi:predicted nucleic acid-binding protein